MDSYIAVLNVRISKENLFEINYLVSNVIIVLPMQPE